MLTSLEVAWQKLVLEGLAFSMSVSEIHQQASTTKDVDIPTGLGVGFGFGFAFAFAGARLNM
jgi:hypothetical protein